MSRLCEHACALSELRPVQRCIGAGAESEPEQERSRSRSRSRSQANFSETGSDSELSFTSKLE